MTLPARDRAVVMHVNYFGQLTARHIRELCFADAQSATPCARALRRLTEDGYLSRIERRLVGGAQGGSGQYVYILGNAGWSLCKRDGRYSRERAINYHTLTIADVYTRLKTLEREGLISVTGFTPEPDSWRNIRGYELRPDLEVDIVDTVRGRLFAWIEVDMATERQVRIREKLDRYGKAYGVADSTDLGEWPLVVFLSHDDDRAAEIAWLISRRDDAGLFRSTTVDKFPLSLS